MAKRSEDVVMPFGKHKGKTLIDIVQEDGAYLDWLNDDDRELHEPLRSAVADINTRYAAEIDKAIAEREDRRDHGTFAPRPARWGRRY
jgi:hypothetical protein